MQSSTGTPVPETERAASGGLPLVSVIIPHYDRPHYLREAVESVVTQDYPRVEVVVVDDGSAAGVEDLPARYGGVRCVRQPNLGTVRARNAGLAASAGEYVVFLDDDDRLLPGTLRAKLAILRKYRPSVRGDRELREHCRRRIGEIRRELMLMRLGRVRAALRLCTRLRGTWRGFVAELFKAIPKASS